MAELLQLLQSFLAPAALSRDAAAGADAAVNGISSFLRLSLLVHVDGEGPAVKLQHALLQDGGRREEEQRPDDGEGSFLQAAGPRAAQTATALVLPAAQTLQAVCNREPEYDFFSFLRLLS